MLKVAIVDDAEIFCTKIRKIIESIFIELNIDTYIQTFSSAIEFIRSFETIQFDLVLLDIEMGNSNGIKISKKMNELSIKSEIIFITSHDEYMKQAFGTNVIGYLSKDEINELLSGRIIDYLSNLQKKSVILFSSENGVVMVQKKDIVYFEINNRKIFMKSNNDNLQIFEKSLKNIKSKLDDNFIFPNRYFLLNCAQIKAIDKGIITLKNGEEIYISRGKVRIINCKFANYIERMITS